ncbi:MAG: Serine phosphatase RsbU, regulator of sigma subunit [Ignavibacteriae bacterium]|nr:MAG: Serine phosphatase RsbU, regulator of sigma subunit [Ignavibacteriota bacterium]
MKKLNLIQEKTKIDVRSLFEFSKVVNQDVSIEFVINFLLLTLMGKLVCNRAIVFLKNENEEFYIKLAKGVEFKENSPKFKFIKNNLKLFYTSAIRETKNTFIKYLKRNGIQFVIPLVYRSNVLGYVGLGRFQERRISKEEENYLNSIVNIAASAIQQKSNREELLRLNRELDKKIHQMNTLFDLSKEFASILDKEKLLKLFTLSLMGQIGISRYGIFLKEKGLMKVMSSRLPENIDCEFLNGICNFRKPTLTTNISEPSIRKYLMKIGIQVIVPMALRDEVRGILMLGEKMNKSDYSDSDLEFLYSLGNVAIISLENTRLFQEAIEKQRMEDELLIAKEIQQGLLPKSVPEHKCLDISAVNISSKIVGGDYYDVIRLTEDSFVFAIADVSGKGTPASLLMASIHAMFHTLIPLGMPLSELVKRMNDLIYDNTSNDRFITFFCGILDVKTKSFKYVNAGHNLPILLKGNGNIVRLDKGGVLLGIAKENITYEEGFVNLVSGDLLYIFTDGVTEAMNSENVEFGENRLLKILKDYKALPSKEIQNIIIDSLKNYCGENQSDDITMLIVKIL